jgi:hypothetical protein
MRLIAAITDPSVASRIPEFLALPPRAPPLAPANEIDREPIVGRGAFDRTSAKADGDTPPGFDFDQSLVSKTRSERRALNVGLAGSSSA